MRLIAFYVVACAYAWAQPAPQWPDTYLARVQALALLQTLNTEILAGRSATLTLEKWCGTHHLASPASIAATLLPGAAKELPAEDRRLLQLPPETEVKYRHVQLRCGNRVLADADNWYVPARLTPEMNRLLETTETPFGKAVQPLEPYRRTLAVKQLWSPLPEGWETYRRKRAARRAALVIPAALFVHRAVLYTREHLPFSLVEETYQRDLLAFPPPR